MAIHGYGWLYTVIIRHVILGYGLLYMVMRLYLVMCSSTWIYVVIVIPRYSYTW